MTTYMGRSQICSSVQNHTGGLNCTGTKFHDDKIVNFRGLILHEDIFARVEFFV